MKLFRNEEVKKIFALYGVITAIATATGWLLFREFYIDIVFAVLGNIWNQCKKTI